MSALMVRSHKLSLFVLGHLLVLTACESGNGCAPAAELRAIKCIDPAVISGAPTSVGHFMLGELSRVSSDDVIVKQINHELVAKLPEASNGTIIIGTATCKISEVGLSKGDASSGLDFQPNAVHMRLDFHECSSGPSSGSALLNVAKVPDNFLGLPPNGTFVPFLKDAYDKDKDIHASLESTRVEAVEVHLGGGTCSGEILKSYPIIDKTACKKICLSAITKYKGDFNANQCGGYAYNAKATSGNVCHLYKGKPVTSLSKDSEAKDAGWFCWNMTSKTVKVAASTPAPPTAADLAAAAASLPRLNIVAPGATSASILTYTPTNGTCNKPFRVITIQDSSFQTVTAKVKSSEWQTLMDMIPTAAPSSRRLADRTGDVSSVVADRVVYGASGSAPPMAVAPAEGKAAAGTGAHKSCKPMPPASSTPISMILMNIVLGLLVFVCGYGGFKGGGMVAKQNAASSKAGYQPAPAE